MEHIGIGTNSMHRAEILLQQLAKTYKGSVGYTADIELGFRAALSVALDADEKHTYQILHILSVGKGIGEGKLAFHLVNQSHKMLGLGGGHLILGHGIVGSKEVIL